MECTLHFSELDLEFHLQNCWVSPWFHFKETGARDLAITGVGEAIALLAAMASSMEELEIQVVGLETSALLEKDLFGSIEIKLSSP